MRQVKGVLFRDYVRMLRAWKDPAWRANVPPGDLTLVDARVDPSAWYPMTTFEHLGNAILAHITRGELEPVRMWGRLSVAQLRAEQPMLVAAGDPVETLNRFRVLRQTFFDFDALVVRMLHDGEAQIEIAYHMGMPAEEAASYQTMGFFEGLLELSGARDIAATFRARSWAGAAHTLLELRWTGPAG